ncbi:TniQ family protein [Cellulomonas sp. NPDC058312]|uniref:TniQ family protein n=1 Tax=Cellulomonas sp. NPDC058312 TaxID=3346441 RepID=UPI0036ED3660
MLAVVVSPDDGESLAGLLARTARYMGMSTPDLVRHLRLLSPSGRPHNLHLPVDPTVRQWVLKVLEMDDTQLDQLSLARFSPFGRVPPGTPVNAAALRLQRQYWWRFGGDGFCPACLEQRQRWWLKWQHPWAFACTIHGVLLEQECGSCGAPSSLIGDAETTDLRCSCGAAWAAAPTVMATPEAVKAQAVLDRVVESRRIRVFGRRRSSLDALGAWRATAALFAGTEAVPRWALRPWLTPPDPAIAGAAMAAALPVVRSPSPERGADALRAAFEDEVLTNLIRDRLPVSSAIDPVLAAWQTSRSRVATRLDRVKEQNADLPAAGARSLPTLAPLNILPPEWRFAGAPHVLLRRCAVSLAAARLSGAATWPEAGVLVGVSARYAPRVTRYVVERSTGEAPRILSQAASDLLRRAERRDFSSAVASPVIDSFAGLVAFASCADAAAPPRVRDATA